MLSSAMTRSLGPGEKKQLLALARKRIDAYGKLAHRDDDGYPLHPYPHHREWLDALHDETKKKILIIAPPGHAKSTWLSVVYPCWYIGNNPDDIVLSVSNSANMSQRWSIAIRDTVEQNPMFHATFPEVKPDYSKKWSTTEWFVWRKDRGNQFPTYFSAGISGSITSMRANLLVLDDPVKHPSEVATAAQREKLWDIYRQVIRTRLLPDARQIVVMTRWHDDDLAGKLIKQGGWHVIHQEAIADKYPRPWQPEGAALWPQMYPLEVLDDTKNDLGSPFFLCMYQGDPGGLVGKYFRWAWFRPLRGWERNEEGELFAVLPTYDGGERRSKITDIVMAADLAISKKDTADYTVVVTAALTEDMDFIVLRVRRAHITFVEQMKTFKQAWETDRVEFGEVGDMGLEEVQYQAAAVQQLLETTLIPVRGVPVEVDKGLRARPVGARAEQGKMFLNLHDQLTDWDTYRSELIGFDKEDHDDQVDGTSLSYNMMVDLDQIYAGWA